MRGHKIIIAVISMRRQLIVNMNKFDFKIGINDTLQSLAVRHKVILSIICCSYKTQWMIEIAFIQNALFFKLNTQNELL